MAHFRSLLLLALFTFSGVAVEATGPGDNGFVGLRDNYYRNSCKDAEKLIKKAVQAELAKNLKHAAGVLRMHFHDCFVEVTQKGVYDPMWIQSMNSLEDRGFSCWS